MADEEQNETPEPEDTEATPPSTDPEISEEAEPAAPSGDTPAEDPAADEPAADEPAAEEPAADEPTPEVPAGGGASESQDDQPSSDPVAPGSEAEKATGRDVDPKAAGSDVKPKDKPPGADLEPIAIDDDKDLTTEERARREAEAEERAAAEAAATADTSEEPAEPRTAATVPADARIQATGKRKSSIARVVLTAGSGQITVNQRELDEYFPRPYHQVAARSPLVTAGYESSVDIKVRVHGGGISGQAGAVRHGIARALTEIEPELRRDLKRRGLLTRDAREKERRKAGLKKARKKPQFSKR
ncbi:MAG: 30S ribosomal protein S9 [Solirubrobacterales bacterium]